VVTQVPGVHCNPDDQLRVRLIAPQADMLYRKIDRKTRLRSVIAGARSPAPLIWKSAASAAGDTNSAKSASRGRNFTG
jgi:hypothetical protein